MLTNNIVSFEQLGPEWDDAWLRLALSTLDREVPGLNIAGGRFQLMTVRRIIAQSYRYLDMTSSLSCWIN